MVPVLGGQLRISFYFVQFGPHSVNHRKVMYCTCHCSKRINGCLMLKIRNQYFISTGSWQRKRTGVTQAAHCYLSIRRRFRPGQTWSQYHPQVEADADRLNPLMAYSMRRWISFTNFIKLNILRSIITSVFMANIHFLISLQGNRHHPISFGA